MPTSSRSAGGFVSIGSALYYSGGGTGPTATAGTVWSAATASLEVFYGPAVATTASPTPSPTSAPTPSPTYGSCGTECWATRNSLPIASSDGAQACAAVGSLVYMYQYDAPSPSGQGFHKYDSATDTWAAGSAPLTHRCEPHAASLASQPNTSDLTR
jgi:hypothetical protein